MVLAACRLVSFKLSRFDSICECEIMESNEQFALNWMVCCWAAAVALAIWARRTSSSWTQLKTCTRNSPRAISLYRRSGMESRAILVVTSAESGPAFEFQPSLCTTSSVVSDSAHLIRTWNGSIHWDDARYDGGEYWLQIGKCTATIRVQYNGQSFNVQVASVAEKFA